MICRNRLIFLFFLLPILVYGQERIPVFHQDSSAWVDSVMASLSEDDRIAQLFMVAAYSNKDEKHEEQIKKLISDYKIGGLMFLQGGPVRQAKLTNYYQHISATPLMIAIDAEWGIAMRLDSALPFPWQMTLGANTNDDLIYDMGQEVARQCKLLGVHINFAPVVDVNSNPQNPIINNRSFGENPYKVARFSANYMKGMQDNNVLACAKHFPGHGDTDSDSHKTLPIIQHNIEHLKDVDLVPYVQLINEGLGSVMVAHLHIPKLDSTKNLAATLSPNIVDGLLKKELGFKGLVVTDALNMKGVSDFYLPGEVDLKALLAGNDVLLFAEDVPRAIATIKKAVQDKQISQHEIDVRCRKILSAKQWMGLDTYEPVDLKQISSQVVTKETILLNRKMVNSSLTLLQNYNDLIPLRRLDTLRIASISIGEDGEDFQSMLSHYAKIDHFHISEQASPKEQAVILAKLSDYNLVIVSVHKSNDNPWKSYKISKEVDIFLQSIAMQSKVIVSIFANPYSINSFLFLDYFDAFLIGYQNSKVAQEQLAQAIFGGLSFQGKLPVSTKHFNINTGIRTEECRLSYVLPDELHINSTILYKIDSLANNAISKMATPGCQILVAKEGKIFFHKSYGYHTYRKEKKVQNSDVYDLASITKIAATVPVLMQMVDEREFRLDSRIGDFLPRIAESKMGELVNRDVLSHQAGLLPWIPFYKSTLVPGSNAGELKLNKNLYDSSYSFHFPHKVAEGIFLHYSYPDSIFQQILLSELSERGEYRYSDLGYYLYKEIIEKNKNISLNEYVDKRFYSKLGMENMGYLPNLRLDGSRIVPTEEDFEFRSQLLIGNVHDMGAAMQAGVGGHAGLFSNANDLAKLMQMYLQEGEYAGERYIHSSTIKSFTKRQFVFGENRRGAGFDKPALPHQEGGPASKNASVQSFGHSGFTGTIAWVDPETELVYIFLSNRIHPSRTNNKLLDMDVRTNIMKVIFNSINE